MPLVTVKFVCTLAELKQTPVPEKEPVTRVEVIEEMLIVPLVNSHSKVSEVNVALAPNRTVTLGQLFAEQLEEIVLLPTVVRSMVMSAWSHVDDDFGTKATTAVSAFAASTSAAAQEFDPKPLTTLVGMVPFAEKLVAAVAPAPL
jgi:hypothetical protein